MQLSVLMCGAIGTNKMLNNKIIAAFKHVKSVFPDVVMVVYNKDMRWLYMDSNFDAPEFNYKIDVSILEDAVESLENLPFIYQE